jgi:type II secretory pathway component PulC
MLMDWQNLWNNSKYQRIAYITICVVSTILIIMFGWKTFLSYRDYRFVLPPDTAKNGISNSAEISNRKIALLFGDYKQTASSQVEKSSLKWKLLGVFLSPKRSQINAVIEIDTGQQRQYGIGDIVEKGISVSDIKVDRVILKRDGKFELLLLDPDSLKNTPAEEQLFDFIENKNKR